MTWKREDDERPDSLLEESGRRAAELGLAIGWTSGIVGEKAKRASETGTNAWKRAKPLTNAELAAGHYQVRCRTRNPIVVICASKIVGIEIDGPFSLLEKLDICLSPTLAVRSRRGLHLYYRPPEGERPIKAQVSAEGVDVSSDGYLVTVPAIHPSGCVYRYEGPSQEITEIPVGAYSRIRELGARGRQYVASLVRRGEIVLEGHRRQALFSMLLDHAHQGASEEDLAELGAEFNRAHCRPELDEGQVQAQAHGAVRRAAQYPRPAEQRALDEHVQSRFAEVRAGVESNGGAARTSRTTAAGPTAAASEATSKADLAREFLLELLRNGPARSSDVKRSAVDSGISVPTLKRAARMLGVVYITERVPGGGRVTRWTLEPANREPTPSGELEPTSSGGEPTAPTALSRPLEPTSFLAHARETGLLVLSLVLKKDQLRSALEISGTPNRFARASDFGPTPDELRFLAVVRPRQRTHEDASR